jgi:hypothetical protein
MVLKLVPKVERALGMVGRMKGRVRRQNKLFGGCKGGSEMW